MSSLLIAEQGSVLKRAGRRLVVEKNGDELLEVEIFRIDTVLIYGNVQVTTQAITLLLSEGVEMAYLTMGGKLKGQLTPPTSKNVLLRMAQHECVRNHSVCLKLAIDSVNRKLKSAVFVLDRLYRNHGDSDLQKSATQIRRCLLRLDCIRSLEELRGIEGAAARSYFGGLRCGFRGALRFDGRARRPPPDPVNSLLSFGYALICSELTSVLDAVGFDPFIGYYHQPHYGRPSLALDLLEEFRCSVVDRFVLRACNLRQFKSEDFEADHHSGGVRLKKNSLGKFFRLFEAYLGSEWRDPVRGTVTQPHAQFRDRSRELAETFLQFGNRATT